MRRTTGRNLVRFPEMEGAPRASRTEDEESEMALPFDDTRGARDPRALAILAKTIYRELRSSGYAEQDVMTLASELLGLVATDVKTRRTKPEA